MSLEKDISSLKPGQSALILFKESNYSKTIGGILNVLIKKKKSGMTLAATVVEPHSGRKMEILTLEPCIHFFSANFFKGADIGKMGKPINYRESFALETQRYPYSPDQNIFPTILLYPGLLYETKTIFRFSITE